MYVAVSRVRSFDCTMPEKTVDFKQLENYTDGNTAVWRRIDTITRRRQIKELLTSDMTRSYRSGALRLVFNSMSLCRNIDLVSVVTSHIWQIDHFSNCILSLVSGVAMMATTKMTWLY